MNVLIVDDQPEVVESMKTGVNWARLGAEQVFTAYSVKEARGIFERERIDILLCDIEMPPTNGFVLLRWVQERFSGVVCIFLTAHAEFEYAQEAVKLGSFDYILQPAPYAEIEAAVERAACKVREAENERRYEAYVRYRGEEDGEAESRTERTPVQRGDGLHPPQHRQGPEPGGNRRGDLPKSRIPLAALQARDRLVAERLHPDREDAHGAVAARRHEHPRQPDRDEGRLFQFFLFLAGV